MGESNGKKVVKPKGVPRKQTMKVRRGAVAFSGAVPEKAIWLRPR